MTFRRAGTVASPWARILFTLGVGVAFHLGPARAQDDLAEQGLKQLQAVEAAFQQAIDRVRPSVVSIFLRDERARGQVAFRDPRLPNPIIVSSSEFQPASFGSGIVVAKTGVVITCFHVVRSALDPASGLDIAVQLHDGAIYQAQVYAADPRSDLCSLRLESQTPLDLTPITIGDGTRLAPGQFVLALGNPFGVAAPDGSISASWGIISNVRRSPAEPAFGDASQSIIVQGRTLVQTDARLNMGSSGAALVNLKGELVGIGTALSAAVGFEAPGGFAAPTDELTRRILDTLAQGKEVEYGFLGISFAPTSRVTGDNTPGVLVERVELPTTRLAGLASGDIIVEVNGQPVRDRHDLILLVGSLPPGAKLRTKVMRDGAPRDVDVALGKYRLRDEPIYTVPRPEWNGVRVDFVSTLVDVGVVNFGGERPLVPEQGVMIREVVAGSPAQEKGLQARQVITEVNGEKILDPDQFEQLVAHAEGPVRIKLDGGEEIVFEPRKEKSSKQ